MSAVIFDPPAVAAAGHKELALGLATTNEGIYIKKDPGPDWGDAEIQAFIADQDVGAAMIDYRLPPRKILIPLVVKAPTNVKFDELRSQLQAKASRINEEGAVIKREMPSGKVYYADVFEAKLHLGADWYVEHRATDLSAMLELQAQPDWYQDPVVEAIVKGTGDLTKVFPNIKGNLPGRVELTVTNESTADQLAIGWAFRARRFSSAETAKPVYEAEELTALDSAAEVALAGASNGKVIKHSNLSTSWTPVASTNLKATGAFLTHQGLYDVWARVHTTSAAPPAVRLLSAVGDTISASEGTQYQLPGAGNFYMAPLGQVNLRSAPFGNHRWQGIIQAYGAAGGENISIDRVFLWEASESSGIPRAPLSFLTAQTGYLLRDEFNQGGEPFLNGQVLATGPVSKSALPGTAESVEAGTAWTNINNVKANDGVYATCSKGAVGEVTAATVKVTNLGLAVPEGATILGVSVQVKAHSNILDAFGHEMTVNEMGLVKAGVLETGIGGGKAKSDTHGWALSDELRSYGGSTDMWANTWTAAQINAATFGFFVKFRAFHNEVVPIISVDSVTVTVYYSEAGGVKWVTSGDAVDFTIASAAHKVVRAEISDASLVKGRYAIAGTGTFTNSITQIKCVRGNPAADVCRLGAIARYTNEENWLMGAFDFTSTAGVGEEFARILKCKAGAVTELLKVQIPITAASIGWRYLWLEVDASGRALLWAQLSELGTEQLLGVVFDADLATAGTLATGKVGFYDARTASTGSNTRAYDAFAVWTNTHDAVAFAGRSAILSTQSLQRVSADGGAYAPIAYPGSDLPRIPVSGYEERGVEFMAKVSRGAFDATPDSGLDPFGLQLTYRPCWSAIPKE